MSTATAFQPTPAHQLQSHEALNGGKVATPAKKEDEVPRGSVDANLLFYEPPVDGSKVVDISPRWCIHILTLN
jgi:hypothetical protein